MRRPASAWAVQLSLENVLPVVHGVNKPEDCIVVVATGRDVNDTGGVAEHGTFADDGPVTWEALISPREECRPRGPDDESPTGFEGKDIADPHGQETADESNVSPVPARASNSG